MKKFPKKNLFLGIISKSNSYILERANTPFNTLIVFVKLKRGSEVEWYYLIQTVVGAKREVDLYYNNI